MADNWIVANLENAFETWNDNALRHFIRFAAAKVAITYAMDLMVALYTICGGVVEEIAGGMGGIGAASVTLPAAIETAVEDAGFWASIPLWLVTIPGSLFITIMSFIMICRRN